MRDRSPCLSIGEIKCSSASNSTIILSSRSRKLMPLTRRSKRRRIPARYNLIRERFSPLFTCCAIIAAFHIILVSVDGAAIPTRARFSGLRIRRQHDKEDIDFIDGSERQKKRSIASILEDIRSSIGNNKNVENKDENSIDRQDQQLRYPPQHHGMSFAGILLAGSMDPIKGSLTKILGTVLKHPKWVLVGGAVYQGQKALRSEAFRRATRFWYKIGPLVVHYKFTRWYLSKTGAPLEKRDLVYGRLHTKYAPVAMATALELKGLYIKLVQVCSSRPDFVPLAYIDLFEAAQDSLPQWPIDEVKELVDNALRSTESTSLLSFDTVFEDMDAIALGSASIGQVHKAKLRGQYARELLNDSSTKVDEESNNDSNHVDDTASSSVDVAVKVMHPGAEGRFQHDFSVFRWLCKVALTGWEPILEELYRQIMSEFDYRREARSLATVRSNMMKSPFSKSVYVPKPLLGLCSKELLVMELLDGDKLSDSLEGELGEILGPDRSKQLMDRKRLELVLGKEKLSTIEAQDDHSTPLTQERLLKECGWATKLRLLRLYRRAQSSIDKLVDVQGYQMLRDGVFQGDPHPGNILELGKKSSSIANYFGRGSPSLLGLIDYGQTKCITDQERLGVARVILALGREDLDDATKTQAVASAMRDLGFSTERNDPEILEKYAGLFFDSDEVGQRLYNCPTPQTYYKLLTELDPLVDVPNVAVFVGRCGFLLRGMGSILGKQIKTSKRWSTYAKEALEEAKAHEEN